MTQGTSLPRRDLHGRAQGSTRTAQYAHANRAVQQFRIYQSGMLVLMLAHHIYAPVHSMHKFMVVVWSGSCLRAMSLWWDHVGY